MNTNMTPGQPRAFRDMDDRTVEKMRRAMWAIFFGSILLIIFLTTHGLTKIREAHLMSLNSVRFFFVTLFIFILLAGYLLLNTTRQGDISQNMITEHPRVAYPMTFTFFVLVILTFSIFTTIFGPLGVIAFFCFWGLFFNLIIAIA